MPAYYKKMRTELKNNLSGFLLVDKSSGHTSFKVIKKIKAIFPRLKVGHAGTLDPLATGLLIIAVGSSTKKISGISSLGKTYDFDMEYGKVTTTDDIEGEVITALDNPNVTIDMIKEKIPEFTGDILQKPPQFSAVKIKGQRAYKLARKGMKVEIKSRPVTVHSLELLKFDMPYARFVAKCSKGTYVRSIARDMGESLGCGACISSIRRLAIGPFLVENALSDNDITEDSVKNNLVSEEEIERIISEYEVS